MLGEKLISCPQADLEFKLFQENVSCLEQGLDDNITKENTVHFHFS